jgi:hypothetical protein
MQFRLDKLLTRKKDVLLQPECTEITSTSVARLCTVFWWENLRERDHLVDPGVDGRIILRRIFRKWDMGVWTGLSWLRIETGGGHL